MLFLHFLYSADRVWHTIEASPSKMVWY